MKRSNYDDIKKTQFFLEIFQAQAANYAIFNEEIHGEFLNLPLEYDTTLPSDVNKK